MQPITANDLLQALPKCKNSEEWAAALNAAFEQFEINSKPRVVAFLAQTGHESGQFNILEENLSYSAARLVAVWPKRFPTLEVATPLPASLKNWPTTSMPIGWAMARRIPAMDSDFAAAA